MALTVEEVAAFGRETGGYAKSQYVVDYVNTRTFPKIHDAIAEGMAQVVRNARVIDMGASTGLLGLRAVLERGAQAVLGFEPEQRDVSVFQRYLAQFSPQVYMDHFGLDIRDDASTLKFIQKVKLFRAEVMLARRIIPELSTHGISATEPLPPGTGERLGRAFRMAGIKTIVVQGRVYSARATHPLASIDREIAALSSHYGLVQRKKDVAVLRLT